MSFQGDLFSMITGNAPVFSIIGTKFYPEVAPLNTALPYLVYTRLSSTPATLAGASAAQEIRANFDGYAASPDALATLFAALAACIETGATALRGSVANDSDTYDIGEQVYGRSMEVTFYHPAN